MTSQIPHPALSLWMRLIIGLYTLALLSYIVLGSFSRMIADDFCAVSLALAQDNPLTAIGFWYNTWTGRYTDIFIKTAIAPFEPSIHPFVAGLFIIGIFAALWGVLRDVLRWHNIGFAGWIAFLLSGVLTFGLVDGAVGRQSIYWTSASILYLLPLIILVGTVGLAFHLVVKPPSSRLLQALITIAFAVLVFLMAGFSEIHALYEGALWGFLLISGTLVVPKEKRGRLWSVMLLGGIITAIGLMISLASPGNSLRREAQDQMMLINNPVELVASTLNFAVYIFLFESYGIVHFFLAFFGSLGIWLWALPKDKTAPAPQYLARAFLLSFLVAFALIVVAIIPPLYGAGIVAARTLMNVRFTQILLFALWGYWAAVGLRRTKTFGQLSRRASYRWVKVAVLAAFVLIPAVVVIRHLTLVGDFSTYARQWDARHAAINEARERGETTLLVDQLDYNMEEYLSLDSLAKAGTPTDAKWVSGCISSYYGVELKLSTPTEIVNP